MKMGSGVFWGIVLIIIGLSLILKIILHIDFPIFRILIAFVFIYFGIKILTGKSLHCCHKVKTDSEVVFGESTFASPEKNGKEYNAVFSKGVFDFRDVQFADSTTISTKINVVFGHGEILLNAATPVRITSEGVFAGIRLPNGNHAAFGESKYISPNFNPTKPYLDININAVFSGVEVIIK